MTPLAPEQQARGAIDKALDAAGSLVTGPGGAEPLRRAGRRLARVQDGGWPSSFLATPPAAAALGERVSLPESVRSAVLSRPGVPVRMVIGTEGAMGSHALPSRSARATSYPFGPVLWSDIVSGGLCSSARRSWRCAGRPSRAARILSRRCYRVLPKPGSPQCSLPWIWRPLIASMWCSRSSMTCAGPGLRRSPTGSPSRMEPR